MSHLGDWMNARLPYREFFREQFLGYRVPNNLNTLYLFGILLFLVLSLQVISGVWLMFFYTPSAVFAFDTIQTIMHDVSWGWLFRYVHTTGASLLFILLYLHLFRGLLYGSYRRPREFVWLLGMSLFVLLTMEACFGYALPWGQLSYWGAQVFTSFLSAIPYVGDTLMLWFRGDYAVSDVTLHRFYVLHTIVLPALVFLVLKYHMKALRHVGSTNPTRLALPQTSYIPFHPFYTLKDALACGLFLILFFMIVCFFPTMWGYFIDPVNSIPANPLMTPEKITPLWYVAPFYAMLRAVPFKGLGILLLLLSIGSWFLLPWLHKNVVKYHPFRLLLFVMSIVGLGILGMAEMTMLTLWIARVLMVIYFSFFVPWPKGAR